MGKDYTVWKIFGGYLLLLFLMMMSSSVNGQSPCGDGLCVVQFNAGFNEVNKVTWVGELNDCSTKFIDIQKDTKASGEEVARFQANIMMTMEATQTDVQDKIDEIIMEDF